MGSVKLGFAMCSATAEAPSDADIARRSGKQPVSDHETQLVLGVVAQTVDLQDRIYELMVARGWSWMDLAFALGRSRQAVLASINRKRVQYKRLKQIAALLEVPTEELVDSQWDCAANDEIK